MRRAENRRHGALQGLVMAAQKKKSNQTKKTSYGIARRETGSILQGVHVRTIYINLLSLYTFYFSFSLPPTTSHHGCIVKHSRKWKKFITKWPWHSMYKVSDLYV